MHFLYELMWYSALHPRIRLQGFSYGQTHGLGWVDFDLGIPQCCMTAVPNLPVFHLPKQNWTDSVATKSK